MTADDWDLHLRGLAGVETEAAHGYRFYFVGADHRLPFATIADAENPHEQASRLDRPGVFRLNLGVGRATFEQMFPDGTRADPDHAALDVWMPHPDYAKQHYVCILVPTGENVERTRALLAEAHALATRRPR